MSTPDTPRRLVRFATIREAEGARDGEYDLIASSDAPVRMGSVREVLSHADGAIDFRGASSLLLNHDSNQLAGAIRSHEIRGGELHVRVHVDEEARTASGLPVRKAIDSGALRGVSISYDYDPRQDAVFDRESNTITVNRWRFMEVSLTPIPADQNAFVREHPFASTFLPGREAHSRAPDGGLTPGRQAPTPKEVTMADHETETPEQGGNAAHPDGGQRSADRTPEPAPAPAKAPAKAPATDTGASEELDRLRSENARLEREAELTKLAREHGVEDLDFSAVESVAEGQRAILRRMAAQRATPEPNSPVVEFGRSAEDKHRAMADDFLRQRSLRDLTADQTKGNPLHGRSIRAAACRWAKGLGVRGVDDWSKRDQAAFALGDYRNMSSRAQRDAANIINSSFSSFVSLDALTKIVAVGFESPLSSVNYQRITEQNTVPDFKNYNIGALGTGNLQETAENEAFPELDKSEGVYSNNAKMWGGTLSLTLQALVNDDTGQFDRSLRQAGAIAQKTVNRRVFQKLLRGTATTDASTWTNNTTTGDIQYTTQDGVAAARAALDGVIAGMMNKVGQDGNPLGAVPRFLVCAPGLAGQAAGIVGGVAPGQQMASHMVFGSLEVVPSVWLATGSGLTGADSAHYYLLADPMEVTSLMVTTIEGMSTPQVLEYDAGAVAARKWKIFHAFEADLVSMANSAGTTIIAGAQQGTD